MPPRKGIVKSGNAGNGKSKPAPAATPEDPEKPARPPPLFGTYKSPVQLLNEKCQKNGWEKPVIETYSNRTEPPSWTASVTLRKRVSKNVYNLDEIKLVPIPRIQAEDATMARHLGATYAMFRFSSDLPMAMVLPPPIRPYWTTLLAEKSTAPPHRAWEWAADPFAARKEVENRQAKRQEKVSATAVANGSLDEGARRNGGGGGGVAGGRHGGAGIAWQTAPEVRMTGVQREYVEGVIRKMMQEYPSAVLEGARDSATTPSTLPSGANTPALDTSSVEASLLNLGFRAAHVRSCVSALAAANQRLHSGSTSTLRDPLTLSLSFLSPLEAGIEWLLSTLPEDDLPKQYQPAASVADFIAGARGGTGGQDALVKGWLMDKLAKQAGFPRKAVEAIVSRGEARESVVLDLLGRQMCGWLTADEGWSVEEYGEGWIPLDQDEAEEHLAKREEEIMVLTSLLEERITKISEEEYRVIIPGPEDLAIHFIMDAASCYPSERFPKHPPAFFLSSTTLPSYIKLHLHAQLLRCFRDSERPEFQSTLESGDGGALYLMTEFVEQELEFAIENPPDVATVTKYLLPRTELVDDNRGPTSRAPSKRNRTRGPTRIPTEADHQAVRRKYESMRANPGYEKMMQIRRNLPAWNERERLVQLLRDNRVVVIVGETGCGKSTSCPQFILDHEIEAGRGASTNIICTQPRRVSALGLAGRVSEERMENIDKTVETVGYVIRGESKTDRNLTRLTFVTTGVILRRLGSGGDTDLSGVSHIIVDEVHERSTDGDMLLLLLRELLQRNPTLKVILMSATINQKTFTDYFDNAPVLEIPGFTHPVEDMYLEDALPLLPNYRPEAPRYKIKQTEEQKASLRADLERLDVDQDVKKSLEVLAGSQQIPYDLVAALVTYIVNQRSTVPDEAILIFMPGVAEIQQTVDALRSSRLGNVDIFPLHANLSAAEQKKVFAKTVGRKIVVATNVAETSITISEVVYVIDAGRVKETQFDAETSMSKLVECYTSRAASKQRRGRAGRVKPGVCFKLFTRRTEENNMARFTIPEILRTPLESLILQIKAMNPVEDIRAFLLKAISPPKVDAIDASWRNLQDLGAVDGDDLTSPLTALGVHISNLPVDPRLAKILLLGAIFKALDSCLTIAALLSSKPLFGAPMEKRDEMKAARQRFSWGRSDILTNLKAYQATAGLRGYGAIRSFCDQNFMNGQTVREINSLRQDFKDALGDLGYLSGPVSSLSENDNNENLLKAILVGGLFPRVAAIRLPEARFEKLQAGSLQKDHEAKEVKFFDASGRVFIHPGSLLFSESNFKPGYLAFFNKTETSKPFLFDATEIPLFALLLFGGRVTINHFAGGLVVGKDGNIKLRAWTRIGVLVNQLRRLLDAQLSAAVEGVQGGGFGISGEVIGAMLMLLSGSSAV